MNKKQIIKDFGLTTLSLKNSTTVYVLTFLILILGIISYNGLPKDNYPEIEQPMVYIGTPYPGNSPVDIENLVSRIIEKELNTVSGIDNIKSVSVQDYSTIIAEFRTETDIQDALTKVKDAVDKVKPDLPSDLPSDPNVFEMNFSEFPIMNINLSGNYTLEELKEYGETLKDNIEKVPQVSYANVRGIDEKEIQILVDPYAIEARNVNFSDIENAIRAENITLSGGTLLDNGIRRSIRVIGEFNSPQQMNDIVIKYENNKIVYLKDIADIRFDYKERTNFARLNQQSVIMVDVVKRSGENLLYATDQISDVIEEFKANVPDDVNITITNDQSEFTRDMVSSLENNIISGVILVVLILLFFLGTRNALFVGIAIPLSMLIAFIVLSAFNITVNMMVLFSLIMALGMLVDNGIVVVENVYRLMEQGLSSFEATRQGVGEVAMPIIASTATTLAAFLPLAFWPGLMGQFMMYLPITLIITLTSSLFVALVINPVLIASFMKLDEGKGTINNKRVLIISSVLIAVGILLLLPARTIIEVQSIKNILTSLGNIATFSGFLILINVYLLSPASRKFQAVFLPWLEQIYEKTLKFALRGANPYLFFFGTVGLLVFSIFLMSVFTPKVIFFPVNEPKYVNVFIEFPEGTDIDVTNEFTKKIEKKVFEVVEPYQYLVESVVAKVGKDTSDPNDPSAFGQSDTPHKGRITVNFAEFKERRGKMTSEIMNELRSALGGYPGVSVTVDKDAAGPPVGKAITLEVYGENFEKLIQITEDLKNKINESGIGGIERLKTDLETGKPELIVDIDREKARRFGLSTSTVANEVRTSLFGKEISTYKEGEDDYEIQLRLADKYRYDLDALLNKSIVFRNQSSGKMHQVPISSVAKAELSSTYGSVKRKDMDRVITISSNVLGGYNPTEVNNQIKKVLDDYEMPSGYEFKFGGEQEKQAEEMAFLGSALMLALFLITLIIVSQFNKVTAPIIIMTSVVFSTIGVLLGLIIFQMDFVVIMTMIGIISLAGIVVNNAIVLIDFIELRRTSKSIETGNDRLDFAEISNAIIDAGKTRLRPVLLTAITTILGLIPLAVGINFDFFGFFREYNPDFFMGGDNVIFWGPMSWSIIFGLTFATFLTLVIVPVMYLWFARINRRLNIS